jgi:hypothetical protein
MLPILTAPKAPSSEEIMAELGESEYKGEFRRDLKDSDFVHWGEGTVYVSRDKISLIGNLAPGPDYKLYLSPEFIETEAGFAQHKSKMARIGDVSTFENFIVPVPDSINIGEFNTVIVWCESFGEFITAAQYQ